MTETTALEPANREYLEEHYTKYEFRIPMRDGVRLHTVVYAPKDESEQYPFWMMRTPYGVKPYGVDLYPPKPRGMLEWFAREKFIFVTQDVRGRYASEGKFVHVRPQLATKGGPNDIDESTDTYDTIEWLLKNVPNNNGRVGISGISYPGFYAACGALSGHPALVAASPQAPVVDFFSGDDTHHNGALRLIHSIRIFWMIDHPVDDPLHDDPRAFKFTDPDAYEFLLKLGPLRNVNERYFHGKIETWNDLMEHDTYDSHWQARNLLPHLKDIRAAMLMVGGWFDAEDLVGPLAAYREIDRNNPGVSNTLIMGPWAHGAWHGEDSGALGNVRFRAKTAEFFRNNVELPFFKHHLKGGPDPALPKALIFETGKHQWRRCDEWPLKNTTEQSIFLQANGSLGFTPPTEKTEAFDEYVSDPNKPVPFLPYTSTGMMQQHMTDDQRFAASRPDVLVYQTEVLEKDFTIAGPIQASLFVSTTGTDSDWVVKLIDVYPGEYPNPDPKIPGVEMGGYQQLVRGEPLRGKFRNSLEHPEPFEPGVVAKVEWELPDVYHTFRTGHRIMVQVQSSWFPLFDRNPQTFCDIYKATEEAFQKATQHVYRAADAPSCIKVNVCND